MDTKSPLLQQDLPVHVSAPPQCVRGQKCRKCKRCKKHGFVKAVGLTALLVWLGGKYVHLSAPTALQLLDAPWPIPSDVSVGHCIDWKNAGETDFTDEFPYSAKASLELPLSSDTLFLISRSLRSHEIFATGRAHYLQSEEVSDSVKVDITAHFWRDGHLDASKACLLKRDGDQNGVGIFTNWEHEGHRDRHDKIHFEVTVTFPQTSDDSPLAINNLSTDLEVFTQIFGDMNNIDFKSLNVKGSLGGVSAESLSTGNATIKTSLGSIRIQTLTAEHADVGTSMGPIEGTYNASNTLVITTSNGHIDVDVNLSNDDDEKPAKLRIHTSNGFIQGNLSLSSTKNSDAAFDIGARSSNARVELAVLAIPLAVNLTLRARTSIGALAVALPSTYEGTFSAATSLAGMHVNVDDEVEDPSGEGRKRRVNYGQVRRGLARGAIGWSEEGMERGAVDVRTSMGAVTLDL
ncbi:hypothetical protein C8R43DRAFT_1007533 [Mycena crocata]|nr:hypothetical protein C8R43DRAFT_1007533 [Mycena crocata]